MANTSSKAERPAEKQDATSPAHPVERVSYGNVSASIFVREHRLPNSKSIVKYSVSLQRSYLDRQGERQWTNTLDEDDLLAGAEALTDAFKVIWRKRRHS
ncbi:hypothetical protein Mal52_13240 [Symmachiella dynata]|uniref:Uncharacterized protein n=2 Tax=Symmachiella dynata TaxID=2527995 RepID=A0A517ZK81_9PLAN|nr:hypothetical protein Mal52_13240 [Symmachiella dynata]